MPQLPTDSHSGKQIKPIPAFLFFAFATFLIASAIISFGKLGWPGLHWDASLYGTPVLNVANGKGWMFGSYTPLLVKRPDLLYNFHGLLHVIVYGKILHASSWSSYLFQQGIVNALTFSIYTAVYAVLLCDIEGPCIRPLSSAVLLGSIPAVICLGLQGRPEQLAPLILTIPLLTSLFSSKRVPRLIGLGICLGLLIVLSPLVGISFFLVLLGYLHVQNKGRFTLTTIDFIFCCLLAGILVVAVVTIFTPFTGFQWFMTVASQKEQAITSEGLLARLIKYRWGFTMAIPAWNASILILLGLALRAVWRVGKFRLLFMAVLIPGLLLVNEKAMDYTFMPFVPFAFALGLAHARGFWVNNTPTGPKLSSPQLLTLSFASLYLFVLLSHFAISLTAPFPNLSLEKARQSFLSSPEGQEFSTQPIAIGYPALHTPSMVVFGNADNRLISLLEPGSMLSDYEKATGFPVKYYIYPQDYSTRSPRPPKEIYIENCQFTLERNNWAIPKRGLVDRILRRLEHTNRYNYALYRRSAA